MIAAVAPIPGPSSRILRHLQYHRVGRQHINLASLIVQMQSGILRVTHPAMPRIEPLMTAWHRAAKHHPKVQHTSVASQRPFTLAKSPAAAGTWQITAVRQLNLGDNLTQLALPGCDLRGVNTTNKGAVEGGGSAAPVSRRRRWVLEQLVLAASRVLFARLC